MKMNVSIGDTKYEVDVQRKILSVDEQRGSMVVRFYTDANPEGFKTNITLPTQNGIATALQGDELEGYIMGFAPVAEFVRPNIAVPNLSYLRALVEADHVVEPEADPEQVVIDL